MKGKCWCRSHIWCNIKHKDLQQISNIGYQSTEVSQDDDIKIEIDSNWSRNENRSRLLCSSRLSSLDKFDLSHLITFYFSSISGILIMNHGNCSTSHFSPSSLSSIDERAKRHYDIKHSAPLPYDTRGHIMTCHIISFHILHSALQKIKNEGV